MMIRLRVYGVGSRVRVRSVRGGYELPAGLPEDVEVEVVSVEQGLRTIRWNQRLWTVPMACIDPGHDALPPARPAPQAPARGSPGRKERFPKPAGGVPPSAPRGMPPRNS